MVFFILAFILTLFVFFSIMISTSITAIFLEGPLDMFANGRNKIAFILPNELGEKDLYGFVEQKYFLDVVGVVGGLGDEHEAFLQ